MEEPQTVTGPRARGDRYGLLPPSKDNSPELRGAFAGPEISPVSGELLRAFWRTTIEGGFLRN